MKIVDDRLNERLHITRALIASETLRRLVSYALAMNPAEKMVRKCLDDAYSGIDLMGAGAALAALDVTKRLDTQDQL